MNIRFKTHNLRHGKKFYAPPADETPTSETVAPGLTVYAGRPAASPSPGGEGRGEGEHSVAEERGSKTPSVHGKGEQPRFNVSRNEQRVTRKARHSSLITRHSEEGVALVITLILLSVTLVMAIAFLAISNRERNSVSTVMDTTVANGARDAALANAEARIVSQILASGNPYASSLLVSTNFVNSFGFVSGIASLTNVNYDYKAAGGSFSAADLEQNIANLFYSPRAPVYYSNDFRFYLDLNRNGRYDTNGVVTNLDEGLNGLGTTSQQVGDPEWIGVLEHPDQPHGPNNPFIARYCFIAVPADSLDLNHIHNQALDISPVYNGVGGSGVNPNLTSQDAYYRNQGIGTWEINLAAFLTDLNTNRWDVSPEPYQYPEGAMKSSYAFDDARALVAWRYNGNYNSLSNVDYMFGFSAPGALAFQNNGIDYYSDQPMLTVFDTNYDYLALEDPTKPWVGAQNQNEFFSSPSDLFDTNKSSIQFVNSLYSVGTSNSTYNRYTFYRMLGQVGTDSQPESGKINLNYANATVIYDASGIPTSITVIPNMETNFISWRPLDFFTAAAEKMLRAYSASWYESSPSNYMQTYYGLSEYYYTNLDGVGITNIQFPGQLNQIPSFGITNIPVYINGQFVYTPAVNRLLQLAANIYDATTNNVNPALGLNNYPSVFRPVFWTTNEFNSTLNQNFTNIYIRGYQYVSEPINTNTTGSIFSIPVEATSLPIGLLSATNVWGVPWIIGAKKGFPNFNAFELDNTFFIERELQYNRNLTTASGSTFPFGRTYTTNQMYLIGISNVFGIEDWNSYSSNYMNPITIVAQDILSVAISNDYPYTVVNTFYTNGYPGVSPWIGGSFQFPIGSNVYNPQNLAGPNSPPSTNNLYCYLDKTGIQSTNVGGITYVAPCFVPVTAVGGTASPYNYMNKGTPPLPQFGLSTTNHLQAYIFDTGSPNGVYVLDYVQLGGMNNSLNVNQAIADADNMGMWSTNTDYQFSGGTPYGVSQQYSVSIGGTFPSVDNDEGSGAFPGWSTAPVPGAGTDTSPAAQIAFFQAFFSQNNEGAYVGNKAGFLTNIQGSVQAPYTAMRKIIERFAFQANDPLVHYMSSDLNDGADTSTNRVALAVSSTNAPLKYLGRESDRYMPWGNANQMQVLFTYGNPPAVYNTDHANNYNMSYKDPLVWSSDNWDFPTNKFPGVGWLGRVHRGTPWQTVYLKSTNLFSLVPGQNVVGGQVQNVDIDGGATWQVWTGNPNTSDSYNASPIQDRLLFDLFTTAPNDNATRGQLSVNVGADDPFNPMAGLAAWSALFSGTIGFATNTSVVSDSILPYYGAAESPRPKQQLPPYTFWTNQPLGAGPYPGNPSDLTPNITNAPMWLIVQSINSARTNHVAVDGLHGVFEHVGDILSANALSDASPFLAYADGTERQYGISDEMYEWMPQQVMSLLTASSSRRYVVYCYGQTLKPAPNGVVESAGQFFDLVTNYQVVAESASRAVIRVENAPTPATPNATPHVVIEQFNPLPPD